MFRLVPNRFGKKNVVPSFEEQYGPIREVRFRYNPDGTRDGGVHQLWVVTGINNDPTILNCNIKQPDFATELQAGNLSFRIPTQMFGVGLIDSTRIAKSSATTTPQRRSAPRSASPVTQTTAAMTSR